MEPNPRITVIVPVLNRIDTLERTLCSVIDQDYDNLELMVADGGSDDGSAAILEHYNEINWWISEQDAGPADAINKALQRCTGQIVLVLPADDVLLPNALHNAAARMSESDQPAWIVGSSLRIDMRDETIGRVSVNGVSSLREVLTLECGPMPAATTFYRRDALARFRAFDRDSGDAWGYEMACRFLAAGLEPATCKSIVAAERETQAGASLGRMIDRGRQILAVAAPRHGIDLRPPLPCHARLGAAPRGLQPRRARSLDRPTQASLVDPTAASPALALERKLPQEPARRRGRAAEHTTSGCVRNSLSL